MSLLESLLISLFMMSIVFVVLCGLYFIILLFSVILNSAKGGNKSGGGRQ